HFVLFDAQRRTHLKDLPAILALRDAGIVLRVVRPLLQKPPQVQWVTHRSLIVRANMTPTAYPVHRRPRVSSGARAHLDCSVELVSEQSAGKECPESPSHPLWKPLHRYNPRKHWVFLRCDPLQKPLQAAATEPLRGPIVGRVRSRCA